MGQPPADTTNRAAVHLLDATPITPGATVSRPLFDGPACKAIAFAMDAGQSISEHSAPFPATVHVLNGQLRFTLDSDTQTMGPHDWLLMPPGAPHSLHATEPTRFVLHLLKGSPA